MNTNEGGWLIGGGLFMAAQSIETTPEVYQWLQTEYQEKFGRSPSGFIDKLNETFQSELDAIRSRHNASSRRDLISDKTLRNFFNAETTNVDTLPALTEKNLNYLCKVLLGCDSYQEAKEQSRPIDDASQNWLQAYFEYLRKTYGTVRIPNMTKTAELGTVYTESNLSEDLQFRKSKSIAQLQAEMELGYMPDRTRIAVSQFFSQYPRLMVWGSAGSGKTTALKALILKAVKRFAEKKRDRDKIPIFIELRQFLKVDSVFSLIDVIAEQLEHGASLDPKIAKTYTLKLLKKGNLLILMDGLDEVPRDVLFQVQEDIDNLVRHYPENHFILTCRYGATEFVPFEFKEVEMTSFDWHQIEAFVIAWFRDAPEKGLDGRFLAHLKENPQVRELGKNPLTLTMLCTMYEQGHGFPKGASALFDDATELYLRKWDSSRRIEHRDDIYDGKLSRNRRRNLFYKLAFEGMDQQDEPKYFWRRQDLEMFIKRFISNIPGIQDESIDTDTRAIIDALEAQDSLLMRTSSDAYTFSYRSFQEYFAAMNIVEETSSNMEKLKDLLAKHALKDEWQQVLIFAAERYPKADDFLIQLFNLMQKELSVGQLSATFTLWEKITGWANVSSSSWRACYLTFDLKTDMNISHEVKGLDEHAAQRVSVKLRKMNRQNNLIIPRTPLCKLMLDLLVIETLIKDRAEGVTTNTELISKFDDAYRDAQENFSYKFKDSVELAYELLPDLGKALDQLCSNLPTDSTTKEDCNIWAEQLKAAMAAHLYAGQVVSEDIHLSEAEVLALNNYLHLLELLVDCLLADVYCSRSLRTELIDSLVLSPSSDKISAKLLT
jgi:predicted NACHT family NTPase